MHVHDPDARAYDIGQTFHGRHPQLLAGTPAQSYLWSQPMITLTTVYDNDWASAHHRFLSSLGELLAHLR